MREMLLFILFFHFGIDTQQSQAEVYMAALPLLHVAVGCNNGVAGLTGFQNKIMTGWSSCRILRISHVMCQNPL